MKIINILKEVKDNRRKSGRRYPLCAILSLLLVSRLCGYEDIKGAWHLSQDLHWKQLHQLGFRWHNRPSYQAILDAIKNIDIDSFEAVISKLVGSSIEEEEDHLTMDGKTLCGRRCDNGRMMHLLSIFSNSVQGVYGQIKSNVGGGELMAAMQLLSRIDINGKVISGDALFANEKICKKIVKHGGDYVFTVKKNSKQLYHEVVNVFKMNPWPEMERTYTQQVDKDHGRIEERTIQVMNWPHTHYKNGFSTIKQVAKVTRYREVIGENKKKNTSIAYIITSIDQSDSSPQRLIEYNRNHWAIENNLHRTRDTLFAEDQQTIRKGNAPQSSVILSNIALWALNKAKEQNDFNGKSMKAITRACARKLSIPIAMLG